MVKVRVGQGMPRASSLGITAGGPVSGTLYLSGKMKVKMR
jgi:hypothetical protein